MTTSYEPHVLIVLPNIGTHAVDQRVADYILQLAERNAKLERVAAAAAELERLPPVITRKMIGRGYVRDETPEHQAAAMRLHIALAALKAQPGILDNS
jgi:hypothetical protein